MSAEVDLNQVLTTRARTGRVTNGRVRLDNDIIVETTLTREQETAAGHMVMLVFDCKHDALGCEIQDFAISVGSTKDQALERACDVWLEGTLAVLNAAVSQSLPSQGIDVLDVATISLKEKTVFGWEMFAGPLQVGGPAGAEKHIVEAADQTIIQIMADATANTRFLEDRRLTWVRCNLMLEPQYHGRAECWCNNHPWQEGTMMFDAAAKSLASARPPGAALKTLRRFFLFRPTDRISPAAEQAARAQLAEMEGRANKKWWQFWK